jgi:hypothetical protein
MDLWKNEQTAPSEMADRGVPRNPKLLFEVWGPPDQNETPTDAGKIENGCHW